MHLIDLQVISPETNPTVVEFVPECRPSKKRPWKGGNRAEPKTVENQGHSAYEAINY